MGIKKPLSYFVPGLLVLSIGILLGGAWGNNDQAVLSQIISGLKGQVASMDKEAAFLLRQDSMDLTGATHSFFLMDSVDVLINNAVYQGEGTLTRVLDLREEDLQRVFQGNVFAQVKLTQLALRHMQAHGGGRIMNLVSDSAMLAPVAPVDRGGWSFAYAASKAALQVLAGIVKVELESDEVLVFNVEPGLVLTEAMQERGMDEAFASRWGGAPPSVPAAVMAWLATDAGAREFHGELVSAQRTALKRGLHADWR